MSRLSVVFPPSRVFPIDSDTARLNKLHGTSCSNGGYNFGTSMAGWGVSNDWLASAVFQLNECRREDGYSRLPCSSKTLMSPLAEKGRTHPARGPREWVRLGGRPTCTRSWSPFCIPCTEPFKSSPVACTGSSSSSLLYPGVYPDLGFLFFFLTTWSRTLEKHQIQSTLSALLLCGAVTKSFPSPKWATGQWCI